MPDHGLILKGSGDQKAHENWQRYEDVRDRGHTKFVQDVTRNENMAIKNEMWDSNTLESLGDRPALNLNMMFQIIEIITGQQIMSQADVAYKMKPGGTQELSDVITKVAMQTIDDRKYHHHETQAFGDGLVLRRGFIDLRMTTRDNINGEPRFETTDPRQVIPDPNAASYDPDDWEDVTTTRSYTKQAIAENWGDDKIRELSEFSHPGDSGGNALAGDEYEAFQFNAFGGDKQLVRNRDTDGQHTSKDGRTLFRTVDRQYWVPGTYPHYLMEHGDLRIVPHWIARDKALMQSMARQHNAQIIDRKGRRVRWTVCTQNVLLHDEWSPYRHFTHIPYFPYFKRGITMSLVDYLISPSNLLNKVASQILHVVNTTANSGWDVPKDALLNMTIEELEERGAETGLILETDREKGEVKKLQPNQIPNGLTEIRNFAMEMVKVISGSSDASRGIRESNESGVALEKLQQRFSVSLTGALTNLNLTRELMGRNLLHIFQDHYTAERVIMITESKNFEGNKQEPVVVNQVPEAGDEMINDITAGEYQVAVSSVPVADTWGEGYFEKLKSLVQDLGMEIPQAALLNAAPIPRKQELIDAMQEQSNPGPSEAEVALEEATVADAEVGVGQKQAETEKTQAETDKVVAETEKVVAETAMLRAKKDTERLTSAGTIVASPNTAKVADSLDANEEF